MYLRISYFYREDEKRKAYLAMLLPPFAFYLFSVLFLGGAILFFYIGFDELNWSDEIDILIFMLSTIFFISAIFFFFYAPKHARKMKSFLSGEQIVEISHNNLLYKAESNILVVKRYDIKKIVKTKLFYVIHLGILKGDDAFKDYICNPQIPIRSISEEEIINISHSLGIPYDRRRTKGIDI